MHSTGHKPGRRRRKPNGFALVVTLSLMILLTILAVGLLTLSSVALRTSSLSQGRQTAQANARMALMLAIGQLQATAGPDQRVTATADLAGGAGGIPVVDSAAPVNDKSLDDTSKGLSPVQAGTRYWTGIWKNRDAPVSIYSKTPAPQLVQWLVSGNETIPNAITPANPTYGLKADGTVADPQLAVVLVGAKSAGNITTNPSTYVSAPLVAIKGPGTSPSTITGRYAWWVGDEGVKAKINLVAPYSVNDLATALNSSTQRSGWEVVSGFSNYPLPGTAASTSLNGVVSLPQACLLAAPPASTALSFHSATTDSCGVLADTLQGGLRLDLAAYLSNTLPPAAPATFPNAVVAGKNIIPGTVTSTIKGPTWDRLKDFWGFVSNNISAGSLKVKAASTDADYAIAPLIVEFRLLLGARFVTAGLPADNYMIHPCAKIAVTLANPYSYPLKWDGMDLEIKPGMLKFSATSNVSATGIQTRLPPNYTTKQYFVPRNSTDPAVFNNAIFHIPAATLPAGGSMAYTVAAPVVRPLGDISRAMVPLEPVPGAGLDNFNNALILEFNETYDGASWPDNNIIRMLVSESENTSQINIELRPENSSAILRKLERLEINNTERDPTTRTFRSATSSNTSDPLAGDYTKPFPLQLYIFQLSQPGADYGSTFVASPADMGLRNTTLRTYADCNLQATRFRKPITTYTPPPYAMRLANSRSGFPVISDVSGATGTAFSLNLWISPLRWGRSPIAGSDTTVLFSPPAAGEPIVSLAQFQHADLTADDRYASVGHQPGNALGNSYASPFLTRQSTQQTRNDYEITGNSSAPSVAGKYYDISYLLNAALWDTYFCSTVPATGSTAPLNAKLVKLDPADESSDLRDGANASTRLLVHGAFNVNSTSKDAWKAFLAGSRHLRHPADTGPSPDALFARSLGQKSPAVTPPTGSAADSFAGFRRLSDAQLDALADEITKQVRLRGPFVSLSQFVNRALVGLTTNKELGRSGALQSALDLSGVNISPDGSNAAFTGVVVNDDRLNLQADSSGKPRPDCPGPHTVSWPDPEGIWAAKSNDLNPGSASSILADKPVLTDAAYRQEQGFRSTGIPGWLTQADVLQVIGPSLAARSDTFKIRAYGEALDPAGKVTAKAWCEAIVQRVPAYIDPANPASARDASLGAVNQTFGRKFNLVSFRWLSLNEI